MSTNADEAGVPRHVENLISGSKDQVNCFFIANERGPVLRRIEEGGTTCYVIPEMQSSLSPLNDFRALIHLFQLCRKIKPDLIHLHSAKAAMLGRIVAAVLRIPVVYTVHGWGWRGMGRLKGSLIWTIEFILSKLSNTVFIAVSEFVAREAEQVMKIKASRISVIYNGVPDVTCSTQDDNSRLDGGDEYVMRIIMPARVCDAKDHVSLLQAFARLDNKIQLLLCGGGADTDEFKSQIQNIVGTKTIDILCLGERSDIEDLIDQSDLLVLISHFEALPISLIEGMRAGIPVIGTNVGGVNEIINDEIGRLVKPMAVDEIIDAISFYCKDETRSKAGHLSRKRYEEKFTHEVMMNKVGEIYAEVLRKGSGVDAG